MIFLWNRKEVYSGLSMKKFGELRDILSSNGIMYSFKVSNRNTSSVFDTSRSRVGSTGENSHSSYQYYIYVNKTDYENALFVINNSI